MNQLTRFDNGFVVATAEMPQMTSVSLGLWIGVGGRYEPAKLCGVSHFIEHMLFKGTRRRNARQISQDVEGIGGYLNAFTTEEYTCVYSRAHYQRFQELLDVLMDMLLHSTFDAFELEKERTVIREELAMYLDQPQHHVHELLTEIMWPGHPLGRSLTGTVETLEAMTREDLLRYRRTHYVGASILIVAAGRVRHSHVVKAASRYVSRLFRGARRLFTPATSDQDEPRLCLFTKDTEQTQLALGIRACSRHDERRYALRVLNTILGENMSSRLFQVIREDHGLAYSIQSSSNFFDDTGALIISAGTDTAKLPEALRLIVRELQKARQAPPSPKELARARDYIIGQVDLGLESTESQMMWVGEHLVSYGKVLRPAQIKDKISRVKARDVQAAAHSFFQPNRMNLALVSPLESAKGLMRLLVV